MKTRTAAPLISVVLLAGTTATVSAVDSNPGTVITMSGYGQPTTHKLPNGFWWRTVTGHVGDCGPGVLTREHPGVIVGYGPGDEDSALYCPPDPWSNGSVNPS